jgi:hypothetical protein
MKVQAGTKDVRTTDPYLDRRSGEDRRHAHDLDYFSGGGSENRSGIQPRRPDERKAKSNGPP